MSETFKEYRTGSERERLLLSIEHVRLLIHELYFERLLEVEEASSLMRATTSIANQGDLRALEKQISGTGALSLSRLDKVDEILAHLIKMRDIFVQRYQTQTLENWQEGIRELLDSINVDLVGNNHRLIRAWVSRLLEKAYYLTRSLGGDAKTFGATVAMVLRDLHMPATLLGEDDIVAGKRQPSFIESIDSTIDHFEYVEELPQAFGRTIDAMIVGGSLSYGPFLIFGQILTQREALMLMRFSLLRLRSTIRPHGRVLWRVDCLPRPINANSDSVSKYSHTCIMMASPIS